MSWGRYARGSCKGSSGDGRAGDHLAPLLPAPDRTTMGRIHDTIMGRTLRFLHESYAVFAILFWVGATYIATIEINRARCAARDGPEGPVLKRSEVTEMTFFKGLIDAGFVATIAFGVFAATSNITTVASMSL